MATICALGATACVSSIPYISSGAVAILGTGALLKKSKTEKSRKKSRKKSKTEKSKKKSRKKSRKKSKTEESKKKSRKKSKKK